MGILADSVLGAGGQAIGVMPRALVEKEIAHASLTELHVVESMHQRKAWWPTSPMHFFCCPVDLAVGKNFAKSSPGCNWESIANPARF
jgi:hypothetical protein